MNNWQKFLFVLLLTSAVLLILISGCLKGSEPTPAPTTSVVGTPDSEVIETQPGTLITRDPNYPQIVIKTDVVPSRESLKKWEEFNSLHGGNWRVEWDEYRDAPREIRGGSYPGGIDHFSVVGLKNVVREFLDDNSQLFKVNASSIVFGQARGAPSANIFFQQYYNGLPVLFSRGYLTFHQRKRTIEGLSLHFYPNISISTTPVISKDEAIAIAKDYFTTRNPGVEASRVILPSDYITWGEIKKSYILRYYLAWKVKFPERTIYVDAMYGDILFEYSNVRVVQ